MSKAIVVKLQGECRHGLDLVVCDECRTAELNRLKRLRTASSFADVAAQVGQDLDGLVKEAIPYVAATSVIREPDRGFLLSDVAATVFEVRSMKELAKMMFGMQTPQFQQMAEKHVVGRIRQFISVREAQTNVRVYVCWRIPGQKPRRWGALSYLQVEQLAQVARDYGILGDGVAYSKDATVFLIDLLQGRGPNAMVRDVWQEAVPQLEAWKQAV